MLKKSCTTHSTTGIFKEEFFGDKMISLCSKSYIIQNQERKQKI